MADYSIRGYIRTDKPILKNGKYPIYLRIRVFKSETKIPINLEIEEKNWDDKRKEPKINPHLKMFRDKVANLDNYLLTEQALGEEISIQTVRDFLADKKRTKPEHQSFYEYFENNFLESITKAGYAPSTIKGYKSTINVLKEFRKTIRISDLNLRFIEDLDYYLKTSRLNKDGGRFGTHKDLRAIINNMIKHGLPTSNPYKSFTIPQYKQGETYVDDKELIKLRKLLPRFKKDTTPRIILQMYLLSCYTGLRYCDIKALRWSDIDLDAMIITKRMQKVKTEVTLVIYDWVKIVLLEFSNGKRNIGTDELVFQKTFTNVTANRYLKKFEELAEIPKHITFHTSRHTFATYLSEEGIDVYLVSKLLGHKNITTTQIYLNSSKKLIAKHAETTKLFKTKVVLEETEEVK